MQGNVEHKMGYIQSYFLSVQNVIKEHVGLEEAIAYLDSEPEEFRSIGYECASMMLGLRALTNGGQWNAWTQFYEQSKKVHSFHMEIGLGWAFAKAEVSPETHLRALPSVIRLMVYDGVGYYYGLFKGRKTVKSQQVPANISKQQMNGFDQGLGRRLWYIALGDVKKAVQLLEPFHSDRRGDLWRGVGIACGYVGGNSKETLGALADASANYLPQLSTGIALAGVSRYPSASITRDLEQACETVCRMPLTSVIELTDGMQSKLNSDPNEAYADFINRLESVYA